MIGYDVVMSYLVLNANKKKELPMFYFVVFALELQANIYWEHFSQV